MPPADKTENILVVDDTPANLRLVTKILSERGYRLRAVTNGARALASIRAQPPDLVLLDIRMPGMDGFEVCRRLKADPQTQDIPIIFISALDQLQDKVHAFGVGGVDYITKPFQLAEVIARVETHLSLRRLQRDLLEANQRMQRELDLAAQVQSSMMLKKLPTLPGWSLEVSLLPAKLTSGDFFDAIRLPDGQIGLLIADVVDKGVGAALFMAMSSALLRTYALEHPERPDQVFHMVNQRILEDTTASQFVTVFLAIIHPASGELVYSNAGHNPPLVFQPKRATPQLLMQTGPPLGILAEAEWEPQNLHVPHGTLLVLYTDGVTDAESASREFYGLERLTQTVQSHLDSPARVLQATILEELERFTRGATQTDDMALILLQRKQDEK
jgi:sigma-B regulation protein RsbU (phosphoserine phosphatase)